MIRRRRLLLRVATIFSVLAVLPVLASVPFLVPDHYDAPTVRAGQAAASKCSAQAAGEQVATLESDIVCFSGYIDKDSARRFLALPIKDGSILVLKSRGGDAEAALDMADEIEARHLVVVIDTLCASSCANYLFPAAMAKIVLDGGIIGYHGGPVLDGPIAYTGPPGLRAWVFAKARDETNRLLARQAGFFARIGVSTDMMYHFPLQQYASQFHFKTTLWEYGPDTLRDKFGMRNILYFQTPDRASLLTRLRVLLFGYRCSRDHGDVYFCVNLFPAPS